MIHYTCDRCKRAINPETETRYIVEIEIRVADDAEPLVDEVEELDQLAELHDQLQRETNADLEAVPPLLEMDGSDGILGTDDDLPEQFDLCPQCHEAFISNPLGKELSVSLGFSNN